MSLTVEPGITIRHQGIRNFWDARIRAQAACMEREREWCR